MSCTNSLKINYNSIEDFVTKQLELLSVEKEAEIAQNRALQENVPPKVLQAKGLCLLGLKVVNIRSGLYGRTVITFGSKVAGNNLPSTSLGPGDIVGVFLNSAPSFSEKDENCSGIVSTISGQSIDVALDTESESLNVIEDEIYKICKLSNNITFKRLKKGIEELQNYNGPANCLLNVLFSGQNFSSPHVNLPPELLDSKNELAWFNQNLDASQKQAVEFSLKQREIAIVHGPPGTGKTTTVVEILLQAVKAGNRILVCAPSNVAVDNILERLSLYSFVKAVRIGHPSRMQNSIQRFSLDAILANSDARMIVNDIRKELDTQLKQMSKSKRRGPVLQEVKTLRKELKTRESKALKEILSNANIILSTLTSATQDGPLKHLPPDHFDMVVIDECSQATEAACWLALSRAPKALLAGDHFQLPPTVLSPEAEKGGLGLTLMERVLYGKKDGKSCVRMLTTQYRMNHAIMNWASQKLYNNELEAHSSVASHLLLHLSNVEENDDTGIPLLLIDTAGCDFYESAISDEGSKANSGEAALVAIHTKKLISSGIPAADIAIVTPYNLQVELLRLMLHSDYPTLEIRSVDGFQGREKEAVILSLVRSNKTQQVGFVADVRRLNVACTRARRHLCLITDSSTTSQASNGLVEYIEQTGEVRSANEYLKEIENVIIPEVGIQLDAPREKVTKISSSKKSTTEELTQEEKNRTAKTLATLLEDWSKSPDCLAGKPKEFPSSLTAFERCVIHEWAEKNGFNHQSIGEKRNRRIIVKKNLQEAPEPSSSASPSPNPSLVARSNSEFEVLCELEAQNEQRLSPAEAFDSPEASPEAEAKDTTENLIADSSNRTSKEHSTRSIKPPSRSTKVSGKSEKKAKPLPVATENNLAQCDRCKKTLPETNMQLHMLRCSVLQPPSQSVRPKQKPNVKPLPTVPAKEQTNKSEDFDEILKEFKKIDTVCSYGSCKTSTAVLGQQCRYCLRQFCLSHHLPEIHGCGDQAKKVARSSTRAQSHSSFGTKSKPLDVNKRAHLQRKLDKKLEDMSTKRTGKNKGENKTNQ